MRYRYSSHEDTLSDEESSLTIQDLTEYVAGPVATPTSPHPLTNEQLPITLGHEFSATVEYAGANVKQWKAGDKVIVFPLMADHACGACLRGHPNSCLSQGSIGYSSGIPEIRSEKT